MIFKGGGGGPDPLFDPLDPCMSQFSLSITNYPVPSCLLSEHRARTHFELILQLQKIEKKEISSQQEINQ